MAVKTNIAMDSNTTDSISLHGWYFSDAGTKAVKAEFYCNGSLFATETTTGSSNWTTSTQTKSGLSQGTTYSFVIKFFIADGREWGSTSANYTTLSTRPSNFTGFTNIASGTNAVVYATDWNTFTAKINEFRVYKGLTNYSFSTATAGNNITAVIFNQAINAMSVLSTYFTGGNTIPSTKNSNDDCYANYFISMKNALNSIV